MTPVQGETTMLRKIRISGIVITAICMLVSTTFAEEQFNIAPWARLSSTPYAGFSLTRLVDGRVIQGMDKVPQYAVVPDFPSRIYQTDMRLGARVNFAFPRAFTVTRIRIFKQGFSSEGVSFSMARRYIIMADTSGNGNYARKLGVIETDKGEWQELKVEPAVPCMGIRIRAEGGNSAVYWGVSEVEIMARGKASATREITGPRLVRKSTAPLTDVILKQDNLHRTLFLWGMGHFTKPEWAIKVKELGANTILLYPHISGSMAKLEKGEYSLPVDKEALYYFNRGIQLKKERGKSSLHLASWPSRVLPGTRENLLKKVIDTFHELGIKVIVSISFNVIPFDMVKHYGHGGQSDWHGVHPCPCMISDDFLARIGSRLYTEILQNGADGVTLGGDEMYAEGHRLNNMSPYDPCIRRFCRKYGYDHLPLDAEDSLAYRRWEIFEYNGIANLFRTWNRAAKRARRDAITSCLPLSPAWQYDVMWDGVAPDILGFNSGMDYLTTDYYRPLTTIKRLIAASPNRRGGYVWRLGFFGPRSHGYSPFDRPIDLLGPALANLGQTGGQLASLEFYENRHVFVLKDDRENRARGFALTQNMMRMIKQLQARGITEALPAHDVAVLYSRASCDWWQLRHGYIQSKSPTMMRRMWGKEWPREFTSRITPERTQANYRQMDGFTWHQAVIDLLTSRGYGYDVFYLDQPRALRNISDYKVLVVPFAYSISRQAAAVIRQAAARGVKVVLLNRVGDTDEWGRALARPALADLLSFPNVTRLRLDLDDLGQVDLGDALAPHLETALAGRPRYEVAGPNLQGRTMVFFLQRGSRWFVTLINFDAQVRRVHVNMPGLVRGVEEVGVDGVSKYAPPAGRDFVYRLGPGQARVLVVDVEMK